LTDNTHTERLSTERRNNPVTLEALQEAWNNFIIANPDQRILTSAMRSASLSMPRENEIHLLLDHPAQKQAFESSPKLISFLRDSLRNDFLAITSELDTSKEVAKILPPKEFLIKAIAKNNGLGEFLKSIQAELD
ncbi:MAG: hypothetical protein K2J03_04815, partial [Muribaculaceae bacterium]|nr:hypothetical protein [Muribaculaceae bacterium]